MNSDRSPWIILILCLTILIGTIAWITSIITSFEDDEQELSEKLATEENVRLSLYRLDAVSSQIIHDEYKIFNFDKE